MTEGVFDNWRDNPEVPCLARTLQCWPRITSSAKEERKNDENQDMELGNLKSSRSKESVECSEERASLLEYSVKPFEQEVCTTVT